MPEHNDTNNALPPTTSTIGVPQSRTWLQRIILGLIVAAVLGILVYAGLLVRALMTHQPPFELLALRYSSFKPGLELLGYSSLLFLFAGYLVQMIAVYFYTFINVDRKRIGDIFIWISVALMFLSIGLFLISRKPGLEWWLNFFLMFFVMGFMTKLLSKLTTSSEREWLRKLLEVISPVLLVIGCPGMTFINYLQNQ